MKCDRLMLDTRFEPMTVAGLRAHLADQDSTFAQALAEVGRIRAAVNQDMAEDDTPVPPNSEVAFFPPVTGG